jgi:hypothetical protein
MAGALDQIVLNAQSARYTPQKLHGVDTLSDVLKDMQDTEREDALRKQLLAEKAEERAYQRDMDAKQYAITKEKLGWLRNEQAAKEAERQKLLDREAGLDIYNQGMLAGPKSMPEALQSRGILDTKGEQAKMLAEQSMWDGEVDTEFMPENIKAADYSKLPGRESEIQQMQRVIQETKAKGLKVPQAVYDKYGAAVKEAKNKLGTSYKTALDDYEQAKKDVLKSENDSIKNLISVYKANSSGGSKAVDRYSKKTNDAVKVMNDLVEDDTLTPEMQSEAFTSSTELMDLYDLTPEQVKALFKYGVKKDEGIFGYLKGESKLDKNKIEKMKSALGITELKKADKGAESSAVPSSIIKQIDDLRQVQMANLKAARNTFTTARDKYTKGVDRSALGEGVGTDLRELYRNVPKEVTTSSTKQTGKGGTSGSGKVKKPTEEPTSEIDEVLGGVKQGTEESTVKVDKKAVLGLNETQKEELIKQKLAELDKEYGSKWSTAKSLKQAEIINSVKGAPSTVDPEKEYGVKVGVSNEDSNKYIPNTRIAGNTADIRAKSLSLAKQLSRENEIKKLSTKIDDKGLFLGSKEELNRLNELKDEVAEYKSDEAVDRAIDIGMATLEAAFGSGTGKVFSMLGRSKPVATFIDDLSKWSSNVKYKTAAGKTSLPGEIAPNISMTMGKSVPTVKELNNAAAQAIIKAGKNGASRKDVLEMVNATNKLRSKIKTKLGEFDNFEKMHGYKHPLSSPKTTTAKKDITDNTILTDEEFLKKVIESIRATN